MNTSVRCFEKFLKARGLTHNGTLCLSLITQAPLWCTSRNLLDRTPAIQALQFMSNYLVAKAVSGSKLCVLRRSDNMPAVHNWHVGQSLQPWPADVRLHMDPEFPKNKELSDWVHVFGGALIASRRMKEFIEAAAPLHTEYLPVKIADHQGRDVDVEYFLVNPHVHQDALDRAQSIVTWHDMLPDLICDCEKLVLDETRIETQALLFRLKHYPRIVVFRRDLGDAIRAAEFTGIKLVEVHKIIS